MSDKQMASLEQIRLEVRLLALENILAGLFAEINRRSGVSFEQFSAAAGSGHGEKSPVFRHKCYAKRS
jgi:hypothetical protein